MALSSRQKAALGVFGVIVGSRTLDFLFDTLFAVPRLNVEQWAKEQGYDQLYKLIANPPEPLVTAWEFLIGPFGLGFAIGALAFGLWELSARNQATEALDNLYAEGVQHRNRLLMPIKDFNEVLERKSMRDWSDRTVQKLREARAPFKARMNFRTFGQYVPKPLKSGSPDRVQAQIKLETIYNEKLERLENIVERLEASRDGDKMLRP